MKNISKPVSVTAATLGGVLLGYGGSVMIPAPNIPTATTIPLDTEKVTTLTLEKREGDMLTIRGKGVVRVTWGERHDVQIINETTTIPLSQIPADTDLPLREYEWVANVRTGKYYSTNSYWGRGVAVPERRLFATEKAARDNGFIRGGN